MKRIILSAFVLALIAGLSACSKDNVTETGLSPEVISAITAKGFNPSDAFATDGGYIVEGDIFLTDEDLFGNPFTNPFKLIVGNEEQYHTTNLVTGLPRTIVVSTTGSIPSALSTAIDAAIARYNAENLQLTFVRGGAGGGGNINIRTLNTRQYIASAGFPSGGNPYNEIIYSTRYVNGYSQGFITTVVAHEMGHCIGFRHTDYMNRAYSCGSGGNEGSAGVGAIHIPGTPTGPDPNSWMLACLGATTNRPFNANDKTALDYLY
jgi:hypothetical protein